jgi:polyhydroxybutyrate depolymerase
MRQFLAVAALFAAPGAIAPALSRAEAPLPGAGTHALALQAESRERTYLAYVPASAPALGAPIVIALHGFGGSGRNIFEQGRWAAAANRHGFIVLAPDGVTEYADRRPSFARNPRSWNSGPGTGSYAERAGIDDVGYLRTLIDRWVAAGRADSRRVFATGFSNGAAMAFRAGAQLPTRIAAIAPVANALLVPLPALDPPVSLLLIWGEEDPLNPVEGGELERQGHKVVRPSGEASFNLWSERLACPGPPTRQQPDADVTLVRHSGCAAGSEARFYLVAGLGHQWPGGNTTLRLVSGPPSDALDATAKIWAFFARHARIRGVSSEALPWEAQFAAHTSYVCQAWPSSAAEARTSMAQRIGCVLRRPDK